MWSNSFRATTGGLLRRYHAAPPTKLPLASATRPSLGTLSISCPEQPIRSGPTLGVRSRSTSSGTLKGSLCSEQLAEVVTLDNQDTTTGSRNSSLCPARPHNGAPFSSTHNGGPVFPSQNPGPISPSQKSGPFSLTQNADPFSVTPNRGHISPQQNVGPISPRQLSGCARTLNDGDTSVGTHLFASVCGVSSASVSEQRTVYSVRRNYHCPTYSVRRHYHCLVSAASTCVTMGGNQSKSRKGSGAGVQGLNFSPRPDARPVFTSAPGSDVDGKKQSDAQDSPGSQVDMEEVVACKVHELGDGETREVKIGETSVLLVKDKGQYYAVGNKCTHYGAPLSKGAYCNGVVRCPWHGACFNVKTGDIEDFPGLDSLPVFGVEVRGEDIVVKADPEALKSKKRVKVMSRANPSDNKIFVIIGGGAATAACAETLRQEGFTGRVLVLTKENCLPYDRPKLSKAMTTTGEAIALRNQEFYNNIDIEFRTDTEVTGVDTAKKQITTSAGDTVQYDSLLVATGGRPRTMAIPGQELENVCVLRTPEDANAIAANSEGKKVVIIGSSFIGLEVAVYAQGKAASVCVVGTSRVPLQHVFGPRIGARLTQLHEEKGVQFYLERGIKEFKGEGGKLTHAVLSDGTELEADICVLGIGVVPATEFLKESGVAMTQRGFVSVDKGMKTNALDVFAAGDITEFPLFLNDDQQSNIQHWQMAHQHGRVAAFNMLGKKMAVRSVPYFWTVMYGKSIRYTGYGPGYDDIVVHGDLSALQFAAFYTKGDKVVAVASLAFDPIVSQAASLMEQGQTILKSEIMEDPKSWTGRLKQC